MWETARVRQVFLEFFAQKGHRIVPSAPLVNRTDPTLFFVNAGMNPFKEVFLGFAPPPAPRVADTQKCLRVSGKHNDLEEVGHDTYHHTFFEMLGNWSFGDYFKAEAIAWAWELLTQVYGIPAERLYVTVFGGDEAWGLPADTETYELWQRFVPAERIRFFGRKDNFWEMGDTGPCGPCTEIHIDLRSDPTPLATPLLNSGNPEVIELWNLVFIQYNRRMDGSLEPLPLKSVDTGMGLERLAMVLQGKKSTYDIDLFQALRAEVERRTQKTYGKDHWTDVAIRVVCDHVRALAFAIADGQLPSNVGAGYVLRRLLRRAVRYAHQYLSSHEPLLYQLVPTLAQLYADTFPELQAQQTTIAEIIQGEEESFLRTLGRGMARLESYLAQNPKTRQIPGTVAFELYDTYGFPLDLTQVIAREHGLQVDIEGFEAALAQQKNRSRQATHKAFGDWIEIHDAEGPPRFVGYDFHEVRTVILRLRRVQTKDETLYHVVLAETPFYPGGGGQVCDTGYLQQGKQELRVVEAYKEQDTVIHVLKEPPRHPEGEWLAGIDSARREQIAVHHTATHLLHAALREILGPHAKQNGSYVGPDRLRFDFTHPKKLSPSEIRDIEALVNEKITAALPRREYRDIPYDEAIQKGAIALFGEKYGERVRMIEFGGKFSRELCGGTHVDNTLKLRFFKILSESAVAAGVRRIEAIAGEAYLQWVESRLEELEQVSQRLKSAGSLVKSVEKLLEEREALLQQQAQWIDLLAQRIIAQAAPEGPLVEEVRLPKGTSLRDLALACQRHDPRRTFVLATPENGGYNIAIAAPEAAKTLLHQVLERTGGRGGGQDKLAVGYIPNPEPPLPLLAKLLLKPTE
ncbi:MAG: alanine--tRNA ligase [Bacteroidia bacterium]